MKRIIFMVICAVAILAISCTTKETTYQIHNKSSFPLYDVVVFEYYGDNVIAQKDIGDIYDGMTSKFITVTDMADYVRVSMKLLPGSRRMYTLQSYYLEKNKNITITITDNTMVSGSLNKSAKSIEGNTIENEMLP